MKWLLLFNCLPMADMPENLKLLTSPAMYISDSRQECIETGHDYLDSIVTEKEIETFHIYGHKEKRKWVDKKCQYVCVEGLLLK